MSVLSMRYQIMLNATTNITTITNFTRTYSPLILNNEWSSLLRMFLLISSASAGTIINGFFIASFFIEQSLRTGGFVYLACTGMADMVVTGAVMSTASVVLMSKVWEVLPVCQALQFLSQGAAYSYNVFFMMVALETYYRLCSCRSTYDRFLKVSVGCVSALLFMLCFSASAFGVYYGMDYDYCNRESHGNYIFRLITTLIFNAIPFTVTILLLVAVSLEVRARTIRLIRFKRSKQYFLDYAFTNLILGCYLFYVVAWLPYLIIVNNYPAASDCIYYSVVWIGLARSIFTGLVFSCFNANFRRAFSNLFSYCFCKNNISARFNNRNRRALTVDYQANGEVTIQVMHHSVDNSPIRIDGSRHTINRCAI